ncbi:MAG: ABC transporter substrate-binding protein [Natronohydrobacter sp.]|nr:ABC transporter substrate-binding protein [Natronohydrobacter sp.]
MLNSPLSSTLSRRSFLRATTGAAATLAAAKALIPSGAWATSAAPEVRGATLGYIALTDASALIVAEVKGFYKKYGLDQMKIEKQASWGATRDNMALGSARGGIDGGHILRPKVFQYSLGTVMQNNQPTPMYNLLSLNEDGQGISVAQEYAATGAGLDSGALKDAFAAKRAAGQEVTAAMTFPGGTHDLWIRYWLAAGGIDPTTDLSVVVVPPPQMVANMRVGNMDCFCVGEPWNEQLVNQDIGFTALTTGELWQHHPEKVLGMRAEWVDANPIATKAIMMAVMEAQMWCEDMANKEELAQIVGRRQWFNVPPADILGRLKGDVNYGNGRVATNTGLQMKFWRDGGASSFPWKSLDTWFVTENIRWGYQPAGLDIASVVANTNRADLWLDAARELGVDTSGFGDSRGVETFFDGKTFDPENPSAYLDSLAITAMV